MVNEDCIAQVLEHSLVQNSLDTPSLTANLRDRWALSHVIHKKAEAQEEEAFWTKVIHRH